MVRPILFGAVYSVYVRAVRLALHEKGVAYDHVAVDVFGAASGPPADYQVRTLRRRIPAFEHDDVRLYEYRHRTLYRCGVRRAGAGQPTDVRAQARMNQY